MKVLIDTNVLVSAALKNKTPEEVILFIVSHADWEWIVSPDILAEYKAVLSRAKFGLPEDVLRKWHAFLDASTTLIEVDAALEFPRDQKDARFLACALAANADFFVTGDRDFTEALKLVNTIILSVSLFKKLVCDEYREAP
jgi:putative PIN family toxin of toxin-antitoxin system